MTAIRGAIRRPEYDVVLDEIGGLVIEARNLDHLADQMEVLVSVDHPREHVGVRLEADGGVWVRFGFADSFRAGTWRSAPRPFKPDPYGDPDRYWRRPYDDRRTPMTASRTPAEEPANFAAFLASTRPKSVIELGEELQRLVGRVIDTGKAGSLTYTVKIAPVDKQTDVLSVNDEIKVRLPEHTRQGSLAWPDADHNLTRHDPNTMPLFDENLRSPAFTREDDVRSPAARRDDDLRTPDYDPATGEIKEPPTA